MLSNNGQQFVDPFTQIYQTVSAALQAYPGLVTSPIGTGKGVFRTFMDMSAPNFQTLLGSVGSGDSPCLRMGMDLPVIHPYGVNSKSVDFKLALRFLVTTDTLSIITMNQVIYLLLVGGSKLPMNLGLPTLVRSWQWENGRAQFVQPNKEDNDARGSLRWSWVINMMVTGFMNSQDLINSNPTVV